MVLGVAMGWRLIQKQSACALDGRSTIWVHRCRLFPQRSSPCGGLCFGAQARPSDRKSQGDVCGGGDCEPWKHRRNGRIAGEGSRPREPLAGRACQPDPRWQKGSLGPWRRRGLCEHGGGDGRRLHARPSRLAPSHDCRGRHTMGCASGRQPPPAPDFQTFPAFSFAAHRSPTAGPAGSRGD